MYVIRSWRLLASILALIVLGSSCTSTAGVSIEAQSGEQGSAAATPEDSASATDEEPTATVSTDEAPSLPQGSVSDIRLGSTAVEELDRIALTGVSPDVDLNTVTAVVDVDGTNVFFPVWADDEGPYIIAPLNPSAPGNDGSFEIRFRIDDQAADAQMLSVTGLPPAPGAGAAFVAEMRERAELIADSYGTTFDALAATEVDAVPAELVPAKIAQMLVDDGTANDLTSAFSSESGLEPAELALLDAIVAKTELAGALPPRPEPPAPTGATPPPPPPTAQPPAPSGPETGAAAATAAGTQDFGAPPTAGTTISPGATADCISDPPVIDDGYDLARDLKIGVEANQALEGAAGKVRKDLQTVTTYGSLVPGIGIGSAVLAVGFSSTWIFSQIDATRYPSELADLWAEVSAVDFNQDFIESGSITSVTVTATSSGHDFLAEISGLVVDTAGLVPGTAAAIGLIKSSTGLAFDVGGKAANAASPAAFEWLGIDYTYCPHTWNVLLHDMAHLEIKSSLGKFDTETSWFAFTPTQVGEDQLTVKTIPSVFSGFTVTDSHLLETMETTVTVRPTRVVQVQSPGEEVTVTGAVQDSDTEELLWTLEAGSFSDGLGNTTVGETARVIKTPTDPGAYPVSVEAELVADTGLFANNEPVPQAGTVITLAELIVNPPNARLQEGGQVQYAATNRDGDSVQVVWSATGGAIDDGGRYTAGDKTGNYSVTATLASNSQVQTTVSVEIFDAECLVGTWQLRVEEMVRQINELTPEGSFEYLGGEYFITIFSDGTWQGARNDLSFAITAQGQTAVMTIDSADSGTYSVDGDVLTIVDVSTNAVVTIDVPGFGAIEAEAPPGSSVGSGVFLCQRPELDVVADGFISTLDYLGPAPE